MIVRLFMLLGCVWNNHDLVPTMRKPLPMTRSRHFADPTNWKSEGRFECVFQNVIPIVTKGLQNNHTLLRLMLGYCSGAYSRFVTVLNNRPSPFCRRAYARI
jgi:hypothetical protein